MNKLIARIRSAERVAVISAGSVLQEIVCDTVIFLNTPVGAMVQFYDMYRGDPQKLKERPRCIGTMRLPGAVQFEDNLFNNCFNAVTSEGVLLRVSPGIGMNLRVDNEEQNDAQRYQAVRKLWQMHDAIRDLERQIDGISHDEAKKLLVDALASCRRQTSDMEKFLSGTVIATEEPHRGRGVQ